MTSKRDAPDGVHEGCRVERISHWYRTAGGGVHGEYLREEGCRVEVRGGRAFVTEADGTAWEMDVAERGFHAWGPDGRRVF